MPLSDNPFHVRSSEQAGSDTRFLGLFGPGVLQALPADQLWDRLLVIRSSPGGGKTSILRLFTATALRALHQNRHHDATKRLADVLSDWGVLNEQGPTLLGVRLSCDQQYPFICDVLTEELERRHVFFALLNARVLLAALRGAVALAGGDWPRDVSSLRFSPVNEDDVPRSAKQIFPAWDGAALYDQACTIERSICSRLNELGVGQVSAPPMHARLWALHILGGRVWHSDRLLAERVLVGFDDVHMLHSTQREELRRALIDRTLSVARWIAERWQGLSIEETFDHGATQDRDYVIVTLDGWAEEAGHTRFEKTVSDIANRRAQTSEVIQEQALSAGPFDAFLTELADAPPAAAWLEDAVVGARQRVEGLSRGLPRYRQWIRSHVRHAEYTLDALRKWRELEVLIERDRLRRQGDLFPDQELSAEDLEGRQSFGVSAAAELFVAREHNLPYYFGMRRLTQLASWNIEQFLDLAGDVFDLAVMAVTLRKPPKVSPKQQHEIVRKAAKSMLDAIPRRIPHGEAVRSVVEHIGRMAERETFRPNAPYAPGVNGFAISMADLQTLRDPRVLSQDPAAQRLIRALRAAVWNNVLQVRTNYPCKNALWAVFYLNRLLCAQYHLPLHYGGFRERKLAEAKLWVSPIPDQSPELALKD